MAADPQMTLDERLLGPVTNVADFIWGGTWDGVEVLPFPPLAIVLLGAGLWFMIGLRFYPITNLGSAVKNLFAGRKKGGAGEISPFAALSTALSGQVGTGNLAGVATAIALGGPGAIFWMWVTALFGMALAFAEGALAIRYRETTSEGTYRGGPMSYIMMGLGPKWTWLAVFFCIGTLISGLVTGNAIQANAVADGLNELFGIQEWLPSSTTGFWDLYRYVLQWCLCHPKHRPRPMRGSYGQKFFQKTVWLGVSSPVLFWQQRASHWCLYQYDVPNRVFRWYLKVKTQNGAAGH